MRLGRYSDVLEYLAKFTDYERMSPVRATPRSYNLRRMRQLLRSLKNPEQKFESIHIAGTKGKGSVALMTEAILQEAGQRTGLYTSPHLCDLLERIQIGGRPVSRSLFVSVLKAMRPALDNIRPTFFEIMTAAAFVIFARKKVHVAIVEVGLGGRLDATNVLTPRICAITRIEKDHTAVLGKSLHKIACEKAGILKKNIPVVIASQRPAVLSVLKKEARRVGAPILDRPAVHRPRTVWSARGLVVDCKLDGRAIRIRAAGRHQAENAAVAIRLAEVDRNVAERALRKVDLPGRAEWVGRRPDVIVDVAHNPASAKALREMLDLAARGRPRVLVFGAARDKDFGGMLRELLPGTRLVIFTRSDNPRAVAPDILARRSGNVPAMRIVDVGPAVRLARTMARPCEVVLVTGSFSVVGEALHELRK